MSTQIDKLIAAAASQIGYYRKVGTSTKFGEWYGLPTSSWCAMFVSWAADQAGLTAIIPKHAYTPSGAQWFKDRGQWHTDVKQIRRGDIVYFDFPGAPDRISHVAIAEADWSGSSVQTIEGNTSGVIGGDQRNGGVCARKTRSSSIVGFGRPAYSTTKKVRVTVGTTLAAVAAALGLGLTSLVGANPGTTPTTEVTAGQVIEVPSETVVEPTDPVEVVPEPASPAASTPAATGSSSVASQQAALNQLGYGLTVDGIKGPKTTAATLDVQRRCGVTRDGVYGPITARCVEQLIASKTTSSTAASSVVRYGDSGAKVVTLQRKLVAAGYKISVDGAAGNQTIGAVYAVQVRCGIARDRVAGPATNRCLDGLTGTSTTLTRALRVGSYGNDVAALQARLGVKVDKQFGQITKAALIRYQRAHNLTADGVAGPQVAASLGWGYTR